MQHRYLTNHLPFEKKLKLKYFQALGNTVVFLLVQKYDENFIAVLSDTCCLAKSSDWLLPTLSPWNKMLVELFTHRVQVYSKIDTSPDSPLTIYF